MDENLIEDGYVHSLDYLEATLLLPVGALISSANRAAMERGGGFRFGSKGLVLEWPEKVQHVLGLKPLEAVYANKDERTFRLLFASLDVGIKRNLWSIFFPETPPSLVFEYSINDDDEKTVIPTSDSWLVWSWHVSNSEKIAALEKAVSVQSTLQDKSNWLAATRKSAHEKRPILFDVVAAYFLHEG